MEKIIHKITQMHEKYKKMPKIMKQFEIYITKNLPKLLEKMREEEEKKLFLEKESYIYKNNFLSDPNRQFFYIAATDIFIKYDGINYKLIDEDQLWYTILTDIGNTNTFLRDYKEKTKNDIIKEIKKKTLFHTIPESTTVQNIINFFTPTLFNTKEEVKHFLTFLGDNILKKNNKIYFVPMKSKFFFNTLENLCITYFKDYLNIGTSLKYKYRGQKYENSRLIYFTRSIGNKSCWKSFMKENLYNFIVVCCHYSARYINADNYISKQKKLLKNKILYLKNNTKEKIVETFIHSMIESEHDTNNRILFKDIYFLWKMYLKQKNIPEILYKTEFESIIREKLNYHYNNFLNIKSNYLVNVKLFKEFIKKYIVNINSNDDLLEISEMHKLLISWCDENKKEYIEFTEENMKDMLEYFNDDIIIENDKFLLNISCSLWDKQKDMKEAIYKKFNKEINGDLSIYDAYVMYCKYSNNNGKLLTVSKKYFYKYIDRIIPEQYIKNNMILFNFWKVNDGGGDV